MARHTHSTRTRFTRRALALGAGALASAGKIAGMALDAVATREVRS